MGSDDFFVGRQHKMMLVGNQNQLFFAVQAHVVQRFGCFNGFMLGKSGICFAVQLAGEAAAQKQGGQRKRSKAEFRSHGCSPDDLNRADFTRFQAA